MITRLKEYIRQTRRLNAAFFLVFGAIGLTLLGLVILASASQSFVQDTQVFKKQLIWLGAAVLSGMLATLCNFHRLRSWFVVIGIGSIFLLILVLIPGLGLKVNGAQRWLAIRPMRLQVSEVAKLGLIFSLAHYLGENQRYLKKFVKGFLIPSAMVGLVCLLVILEPNFGTTALCGSLGFAMMFLAGVRLCYIIPSIIGCVSIFGVTILLNPMRLKRLTAFIYVEDNKSDGAYQLWQGMLAFAAGGSQGVGLDSGRQQMFFLSEAHTDFIFPIIGEEMGFYFTAVVVVLFLGMFIGGYKVMRQAPDMYSFSLAAGCVLCIILQALINMGVVTGLLPTKGMSLPFISYGGSNLVLMFVLLGILLNYLRIWTKMPLVKASEL